MIRSMLATIVLGVFCGAQCGCIEQLMSSSPHSDRTATAYPTNRSVDPANAGRQVQDYLARLRGVQPPETGTRQSVPMRARPAFIPLVPLDLPAADRGPLSAPTRVVTIPNARAPLPADPPTGTTPPVKPVPETSSDGAGTTPPPPTAPIGGGLSAQAIANYLAHSESLAAANPDNLEMQLQLRTLRLAAGQDTKALQPVKGLTKQENDNISVLLQMMMGVRDRNQGEASPTEAAAQLEAINTLRRRLERYADLRVPALEICRSVDCYGVYETFPTNRFAAGRNQQVIVYCELKNFSVKPDQAGMFRTRLNMVVGLYDSQGAKAQPSITVNNIEDVSASRRNDFFLRSFYTLRNTLTAGEYTLRVMIEDPVANKAVTDTKQIVIQ